MCGIVGYSGYRNAALVISKGLKALEYRGYDSAGVATVDGKISVYKTGGSVDDLVRILPKSHAHTAIGHTRWATHGKPNATNAHPHLSFDGKIAIVHNGVIENCDELRESLVRRGITFTSDTDSEIIAHMLALRENIPMPLAIKEVGDLIQGASTFLAVRENDSKIYALMKGASLAVGVMDGESIIASDTLAMSKYTDEAVILNDGECAVLDGGKVQFFKDGMPIYKDAVKIDRVTKETSSCYMQSEIDEIPKALMRTFDYAETAITGDLIAKFKSADKIFLTGCGTAYHASLYGKLLLSEFFPCEAVSAGEFEDVKFLTNKSLVIAITQSGETADTVNAVNFAKSKGAYTVAVTNVSNSRITYLADATVLTKAGCEIAVAATKSYNCQLFTLYLIYKKIKGEDFSRRQAQELAHTAATLNLHLFEDRIKTDNLFFIGKGADYITALEASLKFKEITYKMTDTYSAGELKHGAIALIDDRSTAVVIATNKKDLKRLETTVSELSSRNAHVIALSAIGDVGADKTYPLPALADEKAYPIISAVPLQRLALNAALALNLNPDKPRNLAKSVTVI